MKKDKEKGIFMFIETKVMITREENLFYWIRILCLSLYLFYTFSRNFHVQRKGRHAPLRATVSYTEEERIWTT